MTLSKFALPVLALAALTLAGCTTYDTDHHGESAQIEPSHNFLGIVKTSPGSYIANNNNMALSLSSDEVMARRDFSGDNVSICWGALILSDY